MSIEFDGVFRNCTEDDRCANDWSFLGGTAGVCNVTSGICDCPDGFDGRDDWRSYNDCHVRQELRFAIRVVMISFSLIQFVLGLIALYVLCVTKDNYFRRKLRALSASSALENSHGDRLKAMMAAAEGESTFTNIQSDDDNRLSVLGRTVEEDIALDYARSAVTEDRKSGKTRWVSLRRPRLQRENSENALQAKITNRTLYLVVLLTIFAGSTLVSQTIYFSGANRTSRNPFLDLGVAVAVGSMYFAVWRLAYMWYLSLPNTAMYKNLFQGVTSLLLTFPNGILFTSEFMSWTSLLMEISFLFIAPLYDRDNLFLWDQVALSYMIVVLGLWILFLTIVVYLLIGVYNQTIAILETQMEAGKGSGGELDQKQGQFRRAKETVFWTLIGAYVGGSFAMSILIGLNFPSLMRENYYLFFNALVFLAILANMVVIRLVVFRNVKSKAEDAE